MELKHEELRALVLARLRDYMCASSWNVEVVATNTGSTADTVMGWLGSNEPNGERLIKLWHVLAATGMESPEMAGLNDPNRLCGQLLTFGLLSLEDLREVIGVQKHQAVFRMLRGSSPVRWNHTYDELIELYGDQLGKALRRIPKITTPPSGKRTSRKSAAQAPPTTAGEDLTDNPLSKLSSNPTLLTAVLLSAAGPLVRHLDSDDCTPQERSKLRDLMGQDGMFDLSTHFNRLCSERARNLGR